MKFWLRSSTSDEKHVFVVGPPRGGTTLIKNVLQSHSAICGLVGETRFFLRTDYAGFRLSRKEDKKMLSDDTIARFVKESRTPTEFFDVIADAVKQKKEKPIFLEKTPQHALYINDLLKRFPRSKIIFVARDPRDCLRSAKEAPIVWASYADMYEYIEVWQRSVQKYQEHNDQVFLLRYEDFCSEPQKWLQKMSKYIGVSHESEQLEPASYGENEMSETSHHARLKKPITATTVASWKDKLSSAEIEEVERNVKAEMRSLNYQVVNA